MSTHVHTNKLTLPGPHCSQHRREVGRSCGPTCEGPRVPGTRSLAGDLPALAGCSGRSRRSPQGARCSIPGRRSSGDPPHPLLAQGRVPRASSAPSSLPRWHTQGPPEQPSEPGPPQSATRLPMFCSSRKLVSTTLQRWQGKQKTLMTGFL